jgi:DNA repair protein SbcC/Rad50
MIPLLLEARNFMAYEHLELDFSQFQIACLSGANGSGKSSILDALTWALFEKSRASRSEDVIRMGSQEVQVQFSFELEGSIYRILRSKQRSGSGKASGKAALEFQVKSEEGFRSLTGKSVRETQQEIIDTLHMDYGLFINSSFILQGRADVFTTSTPKERKEVLADILNLKQYDRLQELAKVKRNQYLLEKQQLQGQIQQLDQQLESEPFLKDQSLSLQEEYQSLLEKLQLLNQEQQALESSKETLKSQLLALSHTQKRLKQISEQSQNRQQEWQELEAEKVRLDKLLEQAETIEKGYLLLQDLQQQRDQLEDRHQDFLSYQENLRQEQSLLQTLERDLDKQIHESEQALTYLQKEHSQWQALLDEGPAIVLAWQNGQRLEKELENWLLKEQQDRELEKAIWAQEQTLKSLKAENLSEQKRLTSLIEAERSQLKQNEDLEAQLQSYQLQLEKLNQAQIQIEKVTAEGQTQKHIKTQLEAKISEWKLEAEAYAEKSQRLECAHRDDICPLCERLLSDEDVALLLNKYTTEITRLESEIKATRIQIKAAEDKAQVCREEYLSLARELKHKDKLQQALGQAEQAQLQASEILSRLQNLENQLTQQNNWEQSKAWLSEQHKLSQLLQNRKVLNYQEELHQSTLTQAKELQGAKHRYIEYEKAQINMAQLTPKLKSKEAALATLHVSLQNQEFGQEQREKIATWQNLIKPLTELPQELQNCKAEIQRMMPYQKKWEALQLAQKSQEQMAAQRGRLSQELEALNNESAGLQTELQDLPRLESEMAANLAAHEILLPKLQIAQTREKELHARIFSLDKELQTLEANKVQMQTLQSQIQVIEKEHQLYAELVEIFGQKGIQAVVIENAIPEIEHAANDLLSQMTEGRMHLKFQTLKSLKSRDALAETLDIFISDEMGTRSYETFSAGEAFRINFAIRLAISRMLARRAGAKLQTLVIDEGFGSQDTQGKSRLVEAINAVAGLYATILVITHVDDLKALFTTRIEVQKYHEGSRIQFVE